MANNYDRLVRDLKTEGYEVKEVNSGWSYKITNVSTGKVVFVSSIPEIMAFKKGLEAATG